MMFEWVIIGGGVHGCSVATRLLIQEKTRKEDVVIIDPHDHPMEKWKTLTSKVGMKYLRSSSVHHLHPDPYSLRKYKKQKEYTKGFVGRYDRPMLKMFNNHCEDMFHAVDLKSCWKKGKVRGLWKLNDVWKIQLDDGEEMIAENVVLAVGATEYPSIPAWAEGLKRKPVHVFSHDTFQKEGEVAVIGGGMSAVHLAASLAETSEKPVHLIKRHPFRIKDFDSDPGWLGPKYLNKFNETTCYIKRRDMIRHARNKGSITRDLHIKADRLEKKKMLTVHTGEIEKVEDKGMEIQLSLDCCTIEVNECIFATGSEQKLPLWLKETICQADLPCAPCGFPIPDKNLAWASGLFVTGPLAELEIGPAARNIAGARKVAERISVL
ncbi:FAD/NAD(P)-binding protein [Halobacillus sp. ACCC02827]|uniref:FAD/NAD(P)-binding protein n=1 Tax=Halobacillus sp. ACCC02827 TaxID=3052090 RepID=UPI0025712059|nr:FAD/NAD(P)-binding protein [Halobacillus sp. ACCC02827]WJE14207.1 FAD/NAD(P)-binding protein [Halobacillus sp. ACCC02827]